MLTAIACVSPLTHVRTKGARSAGTAPPVYVGRPGPSLGSAVLTGVVAGRVAGRTAARHAGRRRRC